MSHRIVLSFIVLALVIPSASHAQTTGNAYDQYLEMKARLEALRNPTKTPAALATTTATKPKKGNASIGVSVKGLPKDWRGEDGFTVTLYDNETSARVIGYIIKKGKAEFKNLQKDHDYYVLLHGAGYEDMKKVVTTKKKKTKVPFVLPKEKPTKVGTTEVSVEEDEDDPTSVHPMLPGSGGSSTPVQITVGLPLEVWVSAYALKSGTVTTYLAHTQKKIRVPLTTSRYTVKNDGMMQSLKGKSDPIPSSVPAGGGYKIIAVFTSDDGTIKKQQESFGLATVTTARSSAPVITSFTGPATLKIGETGTWKLEALASTGQTGICRIWWGHDPSVVTPQAQGHSCKTDPLYKHTAVYKKAGTYQVAGEIRQSDQQVANKWLSVVVK